MKGRIGRKTGGWSSRWNGSLHKIEIARTCSQLFFLSVLVCVVVVVLVVLVVSLFTNSHNTISNNQGEGRYFYRYSVRISSPSEQRSIYFPWYDNQFLAVDLFALRTEDQRTHLYAMRSTLRRIRSFCYLFSCLLLWVGKQICKHVRAFMALPQKVPYNLSRSDQEEKMTGEKRRGRLGERVINHPPTNQKARRKG